MRKIAATGAKISAGVAQNINQLQTHAVTFGEPEHFGFVSRAKFWQMPETKPGPKFSRATGDKISVLVELGGRSERHQLFRIRKTLEIDELAAINVLERGADFFAIAHVTLIEPIQTRLQ